jgi:hypothetical protein
MLCVAGLMAMIATVERLPDDRDDLMANAYVGALVVWGLTILLLLRQPTARGTTLVGQLRLLALVSIPVYGLVVVHRLFCTSRGFDVLQSPYRGDDANRPR